MGEAKRRKQVTEGEYLNQLDEMPAEQIEWLDKTLDRLWELAKADGLSHEEFVDLLTRTWEAAGVSDPTKSGKSLDEVVAEVMGKH